MRIPLHNDPVIRTIAELSLSRKMTGSRESSPEGNAGGEGTSVGGIASESEDGVKEQDRLLPIANVGRMMKKILPPSGKISKEAKETMQECVSEFISFVTGEASNKCLKEKRKTLNGDDICWALGNLGFDDYAEATRRYLHKYRCSEGEKTVTSKGNASLPRTGQK